MCKAIREMKKDAKREGIIEGVEMNLLNNIKALMKNLQLTVEQAMDALNVELDKREGLKKKLQ